MEMAALFYSNMEIGKDLVVQIWLQSKDLGNKKNLMETGNEKK